MKNTKWYVGSFTNAHDQGLVVDEHTGENIAVTYKKEYARLISQSPDMYEALKELIHRFDRPYYQKLFSDDDQKAIDSAHTILAAIEEG
jgi:hypothetical protein